MCGFCGCLTSDVGIRSSELKNMTSVRHGDYVCVSVSLDLGQKMPPPDESQFYPPPAAVMQIALRQARGFKVRLKQGLRDGAKSKVT